MESSIAALVAFVFSASITPGPNNLMLMTSGVNFGFRRSIPHISGVCIGFPVMVAMLGIGFGATLMAVPWFQDLVSALGILYLLWLAVQVAMADTGSGLAAKADTRAAPMTFWGACAFQWVNTKAWVMAIGILGVFVPRGAGFAAGLALVLGVLLVNAVITSVIWTAFGSAVARWLSTPLRLKLFNLTMALLLIATLVPAVRDLVHKYA